MLRRSFRMLGLFVAMATGACTSQEANPILPSTGNPGGWVSGQTNDGGSGKDAVAAGGTTDALTDQSSSDSTNPVTDGCDLLAQDCPLAKDACYPIRGIGVCQAAGTAGVLGSCGLGEVAPVCDRGLACVSTADMRSVCLRMCDVANPLPVCGVGNSCHPLPGFTTVGYCQQA